MELTFPEPFHLFLRIFESVYISDDGTQYGTLIMGVNHGMNLFPYYSKIGLEFVSPNPLLPLDQWVWIKVFSA